LIEEDVDNLKRRVTNIENQVVKLLGLIDNKKHVESNIGVIARNKLDNPLKGEPCFACDYHYINGIQGRCNPNKDECVIEKMMEKDGVDR